jgi:molybdopterin molybdotransferase
MDFTPPADVRMRGFARRTAVPEAWAWVDSHTERLDEENVDLSQAAGRVTARAITSSVDVPGFDRAMMDGYAVRAGDIAGASVYNPLPLEVVGQSLPGQPYAGVLAPGQAVRIMTGSPLPSGADAVLPAEQVQTTGNTVLAVGDVPPSRHIGRCGEDIRYGAQVLPAGRRLRPQDVGLLSSIGASQVPVIRPPQVGLVITGNELLPPGTSPEGHRIADANGPMLAALVQRDGGIVISMRWTPDDRQAILAAMQVPGDVVLVSGGSSVGQEDHAPGLLAEHGELAIHGVAMRPSSPAGMGRLGRSLVFLLPGNPVSCLCAYDFFAGRAIRRLGGRPAPWPYRCRRLPLARKLVSVLGRVDYARVTVQEGLVVPLAVSGASLLSSTTIADGFVIVAEQSEGHPAGSEVDVYLYE